MMTSTVEMVFTNKLIEILFYYMNRDDCFPNHQKNIIALVEELQSCPLLNEKNSSTSTENPKNSNVIRKAA